MFQIPKKELICFCRLHQLWGDYILFGPEGSDNDTWCGHAGRKCLSCLRNIVGDDDMNACATRIVSSDLATSLTRLAKYAESEWKDSMFVFLFVFVCCFLFFLFCFVFCFVFFCLTRNST